MQQHDNQMHLMVLISVYHDSVLVHDRMYVEMQIQIIVEMVMVIQQLLYD